MQFSIVIGQFAYYLYLTALSDVYNENLSLKQEINQS